VYVGRHQVTDKISISHDGEEFSIPAGKLVLSPTRTFAPVLKELLETEFSHVYGLIHSSGGGQTKCMKYMPEAVRVIKDDLFEPPTVFQLIQQSSGADEREMYQVFNMGCRMEIYTSEEKAEDIIRIAKKYKVDGKVIGRVEASANKELLIRTPQASIVY
jgi:phosphoribosylformylglycinamidine cyclo-ligase